MNIIINEGVGSDIDIVPDHNALADHCMFGDDDIVANPDRSRLSKTGGWGHPRFPAEVMAQPQPTAAEYLHQIGGLHRSGMTRPPHARHTCPGFDGTDAIALRVSMIRPAHSASSR